MCSMNRLSREERGRIIRALVEGNSLRSTVRITGFALNTITKLLVELGDACAAYENEHLRSLPASRIECDEIWSFVGSKDKNVPEDRRDDPDYGDVWTWTALDPDTKLMCSWLVGDRSPDSAHQFIADLGTRLAHRVQITTDGYGAYPAAIEATFGRNVDYAQLIKDYGQDLNDRKFSPPVVVSQHVNLIEGDPDPSRISTSYVERQNLTMRMGMRRFTRLTNAFSKKVRNHAAAVSLHFFYMNWGRPHKTLANPYARTPAMAAGLSDHVWTCEEIAALLD